MQPRLPKRALPCRQRFRLQDPPGVLPHQSGGWHRRREAQPCKQGCLRWELLPRRQMAPACNTVTARHRVTHARAPAARRRAARRLRGWVGGSPGQTRPLVTFPSPQALRPSSGAKDAGRGLCGIRGYNRAGSTVYNACAVDPGELLWYRLEGPTYRVEL